jgi:hypothetical protein
MSNFYCKIKVKKTGEIKKVQAIDNYWGPHRYGYMHDNEVYLEDEVEIIPEPEVVWGEPLKKPEPVVKLNSAQKRINIQKGKDMFEPVKKSNSETRRINIMKEEKPKECKHYKLQMAVIEVGYSGLICQECGKKFTKKGIEKMIAKSYKTISYAEALFNNKYLKKDGILRVVGELPKEETKKCNHEWINDSYDNHLKCSKCGEKWDLFFKTLLKPVESRDEGKTLEEWIAQKGTGMNAFEEIRELQFKVEKLEQRIDEQDKILTGHWTNIDRIGEEATELQQRLGDTETMVIELKEKHNEAGHVFEASTRNMWTEIGLLKDKVDEQNEHLEELDKFTSLMGKQVQKLTKKPCQKKS